ncbi:MAG: hypothetical protein BACD_00777 [Bacteroides rodentium]
MLATIEKIDKASAIFVNTLPSPSFPHNPIDTRAQRWYIFIIERVFVFCN